MTKNINHKKGFTIIEVVLVLAIAGLIFLMVFIAFPALQRSQRDTQRTDDMARVQSALMNWQNNHSNKLPGPASGNTSVAYPGDSDEGAFDVDTGAFKNNCPSNNNACVFLRDYMNAASTETGTVDLDNGGAINSFKDPSGDFYNLVVTKNISGSDNDISTVGHTNPDTDGTMKISGNSTDGYTLDGDFVAYTMFIIPGATCQEDLAVPSQRNNFAILYRMEGSGVKCTNNGS